MTCIYFKRPGEDFEHSITADSYDEEYDLFSQLSEEEYLITRIDIVWWEVYFDCSLIRRCRLENTAELLADQIEKSTSYRPIIRKVVNGVCQ